MWREREGGRERETGKSSDDRKDFSKGNAGTSKCLYMNNLIRHLQYFMLELNMRVQMEVGSGGIGSQREREP